MCSGGGLYCTICLILIHWPFNAIHKKLNGIFIILRLLISRRVESRNVIGLLGIDKVII